MANYLVVANQTLGGAALARRVDQIVAADRDARFVIVAPVVAQTVLPTEIGGVMGGVAVLDVETQQYLERDADERLAALVDWLQAKGVPAHGTTVLGDPLPTIERLVGDQAVDEVVVSTLPSRISRWLRVDLSRRIQRRIDVPVTTVTADDTGVLPDAVAPPAAAETNRRRPVGESVYKIVELIGTSTESWEKAAAAAVATASRSLRDLRVAEIAELDLVIDEGNVTAYRAKIKVSFKYETPD
jgi:flavin-binding protein dodecin